MKTADVELKAPEKPKGGLGALFGMSEARKEKAPKYKAGTHPSAGGAAAEKTKVSQSIADVVDMLRADQAQKIAVHSDKGFYDSFRTAAGDITCVWLSNDFVVDQQLGALPLGADQMKDCQAIVVGGPDVATKYRYSLTRDPRPCAGRAGPLGGRQLGVLRRHCGGAAGDRRCRRAGLQSLRGILRHQGCVAVPFRADLRSGHQAQLPGARPQPVRSI